MLYQLIYAMRGVLNVDIGETLSLRLLNKMRNQTDGGRNMCITLRNAYFVYFLEAQ